jgi:hypothetical protein
MRYSACLASFAHEPTIVRLFIHPMVMMIEVYFLAIHVLTENIIFGCWDYTKPFISAIVHVPSSKAMTITDARQSSRAGTHKTFFTPNALREASCGDSVLRVPANELV